jgi:hypothetical protein
MRRQRIRNWPPYLHAPTFSRAICVIYFMLWNCRRWKPRNYVFLCPVYVFVVYSSLLVAFFLFNSVKHEIKSRSIRGRSNGRLLILREGREKNVPNLRTPNECATCKGKANGSGIVVMSSGKNLSRFIFAFNPKFDIFVAHLNYVTEFSFLPHKIHTIKKLRGFGPLANYDDRATAVSWRSSANFCR